MAYARIVTNTHGTIIRNVKMDGKSTGAVDSVASALDSLIEAEHKILHVEVSYEGCDDSITYEQEGLVGDILLPSLATGEKRTWTPEQQQFMLDNHEDMYIEDIATVVGKTVKATEGKAFRMGCSIKSKPKGTK